MRKRKPTSAGFGRGKKHVERLYKQREQLFQEKDIRQLLKEDEAFKNAMMSVAYTGKPLKRTQNATFTQILYLYQTGQPIRKQDFHKSIWESLIKKGYITKQGKPIMSHPWTQREYQLGQEYFRQKFYQKIYKTHPQQQPETLNRIFKQMKSPNAFERPNRSRMTKHEQTLADILFGKKK